MTTRTHSGFPKHFLWGAASAAHQVEGDLHNQWTVWELENARSLAAQADYHISDFASWERIKDHAKNPNNYVSGIATDHRNRYKEDFDLLEKMNMNAYRFSIEWSRIEPEEGVWDAEAIAHYKAYIRELKRRDIEPVVTLLHFSLPVWFAEKGGFTKRSNVKYFTRYVEKMMHELSSELSRIITINEPEVYSSISYYAQMWPPAERSLYRTWRVTNNLITAHNRAAKLIHKMGRRYKVSLAKHSLYVYAGDNAWISRLTANIFQYMEDDYILKRVIKNCDFIGLNYYQSMRVYGYRIHNPETPRNDLDWVMAPGDIELVLERLYEKYKKPILITENGVADGEDVFRQDWIKDTIVAMQAAMKKGVEVQGYLHWSLTDNFEWSYGKWPRFGLAAIDYKTQKRTLRPSALWFGRVIKKLRGL
ncbi:MAG: family 1 glycosylhydrolase [Candidatus Saccharimonadales bacterium]